MTALVHLHGKVEILSCACPLTQKYMPWPRIGKFWPSVASNYDKTGKRIKAASSITPLALTFQNAAFVSKGRLSKDVGEYHIQVHGEYFERALQEWKVIES